MLLEDSQRAFDDRYRGRDRLGLARRKLCSRLLEDFDLGALLCAGD